MQLEKQCCTLEQGKRLLELGLKDESLFAHYMVCYDPTGEASPAYLIMSATDPETKHGEILGPAFTVAELGLACRDCISGTAKDGRFYATPDEYADYDIDSVIEESPLPDPLPCYVERDTQAIALADLLIWLLKTGLLTADEVNERLNKE